MGVGLRGLVAKAVAGLVPRAFGVLVEVNAAFADLLGYRREDLAGRPCTVVRIAPGRVLVRVEDNGRGVPAEFRPKLSQRPARAERDAARVRGTGLGLYIVRSLAQANDAEVRYEPNPAGGSVFVVDLEAA